MSCVQFRPQTGMADQEGKQHENIFASQSIYQNLLLPLVICCTSTISCELRSLYVHECAGAVNIVSLTQWFLSTPSAC